MTSDPTPDLAGLCAALAAELDEVAPSDEGEVVSYRRGGTTFARVSDARLEVRLPADIAEAAARTPDTALGSEPGWILFTPASSERHVVDRATAWFQTAWRHAGPA